MMRLQTPQRVLAIVGGAFLIGTGQAVIFGPVTLDPASTTTGTKGVIGDPSRLPNNEPAVPALDTENDTENDIENDAENDAEKLKQAVDDATAQMIPDDTIPDDLVPDNFVPSATFAAENDPLLDAPVPDGTLTLRETKELWDMGAYFIDARLEHKFNQGHIKYASLLLAQWFDSDPDRAFAVTDSIPTNATIVIYCVGGECDASKNTAAWLEPLGYTDLRIMGAGYEHWVEAGFETEMGAEP